MANSIDPALLVGRALVQEGILSENDLQTVIQAQAGTKIGDELVTKGLVRREAVEAVIHARDGSSVSLEETVFGEIAVRNGFVTREALAECLSIQETARARATTVPRIGEILLDKGHLNQQKVGAVLKRQEALLQAVALRDNSEVCAQTEMQPGSDRGATLVAEAGTSQPQCSNDETAASKASGDRPARSGLANLLMPEAASPVACQACQSSANSPLAVVCGSCGGPLTAKKDGARRAGPWGLRVAFAVTAGVSGFIAYGCSKSGAHVSAMHCAVGMYGIAAVMFLLFGAAMLRNYGAALRYFLTVAILAFAGVYVVTGLVGQSLGSAFDAMKLTLTWHILPPSVAIIIAGLVLPLAVPMGVPRFRGIGAFLAVFALLFVVCLATGRTLYGHAWPLWSLIALSATGLLLFVVLCALMFSEGFRVATRRPAVIIEASRPLQRPRRPERQARDVSGIPSMIRPFVSAYEMMLWSLRMSVHHLVSSLVSFANMVVYWMEFVTDLLIRSLIRAWRRLVALVRAFGRTLAAIIVFGVVATWRVILTIVLPVAFLIAGAVVAKTFADSTLAYVLGSGWTELLKAGLYAGILFLTAIIVVGLLVRCHPSSVVVKEGFQAFSYHLPNFLLLLYVTSIALSLLSWATKAGPFRFGLLSIILTAFLVVLFAVVILRSKKKPRATETTVSGGALPDAADQSATKGDVRQGTNARP
jgi:hypothetical protein